MIKRRFTGLPAGCTFENGRLTFAVDDMPLPIEVEGIFQSEYRATMFVYWVYDELENLLYVGSSTGIIDRFRGHARTSRWWRYACRVEVREGSREEEQKEIERMIPAFNIQGRNIKDVLMEKYVLARRIHE